MKKQIIIFDFDNTLVDSLKYWHRVLDKEMFKKYKKKVDKRMSSLRIGTTNREMAEIFMQLAGIQASYEEISDGWTSMMENYYFNKIKLIKYAKEFLYQLKQQGKTLAIATATKDDLLIKALEHFGINIFDHIFTEFNLNSSKFQPIFFENLMRSINAKPDDIIFFEDSYSSIQSAVSNGIECYAILHKHNKKHSHDFSQICTKTIKNYKPLLK